MNFLPMEVFLFPSPPTDALVFFPNMFEEQPGWLGAPGNLREIPRIIDSCAVHTTTGLMQRTWREPSSLTKQKGI
jgi:hypothetical protein